MGLLRQLRGCCTYASLVCLFHDAACRCCVVKELCGPKCKPDNDCNPPQPWPWENLQQLANTSNIQQPTTKTLIETKEVTSKAPNVNSDDSQKLYSKASYSKTEVTSDLPEILPDEYLENTTPFADYMNDDYDDYSSNVTVKSEKENIEKSIDPDTHLNTDDAIFSSKEQADLLQSDVFKVNALVEGAVENHENKHNQISSTRDNDTKLDDANGELFAETETDTTAIQTFENVGNENTTLEISDKNENITRETADIQVKDANTNATTQASHIEQSEAIGYTPLEEYGLEEYEKNKAIDKIDNIMSEDANTLNNDTQTNHESLNENETIDANIESELSSPSLLQPPPPLPPPPLPMILLKPGNIGVYLNRGPDLKSDESDDIQAMPHSEVNEGSEVKSQSEFQINEETNPDVKVESGNWLDETMVYSENINDAGYANNSDSDLSGTGVSRKEFEDISEKDTVSKGNSTNDQSKNTGQIEDGTYDGRLAQIGHEGGPVGNTSTIVTTVMNNKNNDNITVVEVEQSALNNTHVNEAEAAAPEKTEAQLDEERTSAYENTTLEENQQQEDENDRNYQVNENSDVQAIFSVNENTQDKTGKDNAHQADADVTRTNKIANETNGTYQSKQDFGEIIRGQEDTQDQNDESKYINGTATDNTDENTNNLQETTIHTIDGGNAYPNVDEIKYTQETEKDQTEHDSAHLDTAKGETFEDEAHLDVEEIRNTLEKAEKSDYIPTDYFNDLAMDKELFYKATEVLGLGDKTDRKDDLS